MAATPKPAPVFVQRVARIPEVLAVVSAYPAGLTLGDLAARFGTEPRTLREDLATYADLESWGWTFDIFRRAQIEFAGPGPGPGSDDADPAKPDGPDEPDEAQTIVRVVSDDVGGLGAEHLSAGALAAIYTAGVALLDVQPDPDLADALTVISETMYGEPVGPPLAPDWQRFLDPLQRARDEQCRVRLVYSRAWHEGVIERVVEPLRLVQTHRGWEMDAGPVGAEGNLRTYLLSNVRDAEPLADRFEPPAHLEALLTAQRRTTTVRLEMVQDARWAADVHAEQVTVVADDEDTFIADLELLPPVGERVGLLMLAGGPTTRVLRPVALLPEATALIEELLAHHERR